MDQNKNYEKQLTFHDLFLLIIKKIKRILIIGFCMAVIIVCYQYITGKDSMMQETKSTFEQREDYIGRAKLFLGADMDTITSEAIRTYLIGNDVLQSVITYLNTGIDYNTLFSMISLENSTDTIVMITIVGSDESLVQNLTSSLSTIGCSKIITAFKKSGVIVLEPAYTEIYIHKIEIPIVETSYFNLIKNIIEYFVIGFSLGVFLVIGFYYLLYLVDDRIRVEKDVEGYLGLKVLGSMPTIKVTREPPSILDNKATEEMKRIRTNLLMLEPDRNVINITSVIEKEGKSMISFWLSRSLTELGKKVLLVDGNIRRRNQYDIYIKDQDQSLSESENESESEIESESESKSESESESESEIESESESESESENESKIESESDIESKSKSEIESKIEIKSESKNESKIESKSDIESKSEIESDSKIESESEIESKSKNEGENNIPLLSKMVDKKINVISDYLIGKVRKEELACNTNIANLDIILSGGIQPNPVELLNGSVLGDLITYLKDKYDYIIIDTPALGEVTDAAIIATHCDCSILVLEPGAVNYRIAQKVVDQLKNTGTKLLGVIFNKV